MCRAGYRAGGCNSGLGSGLYLPRAGSQRACTEGAGWRGRRGPACGRGPLLAGAQPARVEIAKGAGPLPPLGEA